MHYANLDKSSRLQRVLSGDVIKIRHFINLTNGIQALKDYKLLDYRFIRIQSTACEQKRFEEIILSISDDFLMSAALGYECVVYDYGANKKIPRAVWQGLEWIKYALTRNWYGQEYLPKGRSAASKKYFSDKYAELSEKAKNRIKYFGKYSTGQLRISAITDATDKDGNYEWYVEIIKEFYVQ